MNKLIVALIAGAFAAVAGAQTPATTADKQQMLKSTTEAASNANTGATTAKQGEMNTAKSKKHAKVKDKKAKQEMAKSTTDAASNANTGAKAAADAAKNSAASKADSAAMKPAPNMADHQKALEKASKP
jgi:hypothetical protein